MLVVIYCILFTAPYTLINRVFSTWLYVYMFLGLKFWRRIPPTYINNIFSGARIGFFTSCIKKQYNNSIWAFGHHVSCH